MLIYICDHFQSTVALVLCVCVNGAVMRCKEDVLLEYSVNSVLVMAYLIVH